MRKICRNCERLYECEIEKNKRKRLWHGSWDEWTCGNWKQAENIQVTIFDHTETTTGTDCSWK